jgi:signal transduction histidine kinase
MDRHLNSLDMQVPQISPDLQNVLQQIVNNVVDRFGYIGAMVATLEQADVLVVRAYKLSDSLENLQETSQLEELDAIEMGTCFDLKDSHYQDNLAVKAVVNHDQSDQTSLTSESLHDLFSPYLTQDRSKALQQIAGVQQVIAVPFRLYGNAVGSLMAATPERLTERDVEFLTAFGQQAATTIQNQRRLDSMKALEQIILRLQAHMTSETEVLQTIVDAVVEDLGYAGAMVATLENGNALPVRAFAVDETMRVVQQFEAQAGASMLGEQAVAYLDDEQYQDNLSVRAVTGLNGRPENYLISENLYDLFRPVVSREVADQIQQMLGIKRVVAVPFFLVDQVLGNLFVTSRKTIFSTWELSLLTALGQQAAVGINNARLFRETAEQRQIAQTFGRMAFSTIASAHSLRNYVGNVSSYVQLLQMMPELSPERQQFVLRELPTAADQLEKIVAILDNLNEPWQTKDDEPVDVHDCMARALLEIYPRTSIFRDTSKVVTETDVTLYLDFAESLTPAETVKDMLSEAFRIIIKNAAEAMASSDREAKMWIATKLISDSEVEIIIRDNGPGISPENLRNIFELGWSTKKRAGGMGFGLFWTKDYIDGLGGSIKASSRLGEGTTFTITLPLVVPEKAAV